MRQERRKKSRAYKTPSRLQIRLTRLLSQNRTLLEEAHVSRSVYLVMLLICGTGGFLAGRAVFSSMLLAAFSAVFCLAVPTAFFARARNKREFDRLEKLSADMMVLSNSYLVTNDLIKSVSKNLDVLEYPKPFRDFLAYVTYIDSDIVEGLRRMEAAVGNGHFSQWVDALVMAQRDRQLAYVAIAIVDGMRNSLAAQRDSDAEMTSVWVDYFSVLAMIFAILLIIRTLMPDAYRLASSSLVGQGLLLLLIVSIAYSVVKALRINRPLSM